VRKFIPILFVPALALVACGSSPQDSAAASREQPATTTEALGSCNAGETMQCSNETPNGKKVCACVPVPCFESVPMGGSPYDFIQAWTFPGSSCPEVPTYAGNTFIGTWAQFGTDVVPMPSTFDGVPTQWGVNPAPPTGNTFCTYVWWPAGFPGALDASMPMPQPQALCSTTVSNISAVVQPGSCSGAGCGKIGGGHGCTKCAQP
jgi:hypothetical protein